MAKASWVAGGELTEDGGVVRCAAGTGNSGQVGDNEGAGDKRRSAI